MNQEFFRTEMKPKTEAAMPSHEAVGFRMMVR